MTKKRLALGLWVGLVFPATLSPQEPRESKTPLFRSDVSVVLLPVFVIDKDGKAVRGLSAADFEVKADGRRADVVSFRYVDTTDDDEDELRVASAARRRFLLLFDKSFTDLAGLDRARRAAADFVKRRLTPSDLAGVATFDVQSGIRVIANFTEDRALLAHAVASLGVPQISRISDPLGLAADLGVADITIGRDTEAVADQDMNGALAVLARQMRSAEEEAYRSHVTTLIVGLRDLAAGLSSVEGRKQVVYLSAGFDARMLVGQWGSEQRQAADSVTQGRLWEVDGLTRYGDSRLRDLLAEATRDLARADAVVHSVDVTGLGGDRSLQRMQANQDLVRDTTNRESLGYLATETGGRFFRDANDLAPALAEMLEMTSRYYVLGIQPAAEAKPGAFHEVKVKVARKGVKLSHRPGYFERTEATASQTRLQRQFDLAELLVTGEGQDDMPFTSLCLPFPAPGEQQTLGLVLQVPRGALPWSSSEPIALEVYGYAVAEDGSVRDHLAQLVKVDSARSDPQGRASGVSLFGTFQVPPGRYTVRLMVRESASGKSAVRLLDVTVPPYDGRAVFTLPPLVLDETDRWLRLEMGPGKASASGEVPFRVDAEPFVPRTSFEVRPGAHERLVMMVWDPEMLGDPAADIEIRSSLTASDGRAVEPGRLKVERVLDDGEGRRTFVFSYLPEDVESGDYTLRISLGESGGFAQSYALLRFRTPKLSERGPALPAPSVAAAAPVE
jgi:VWFA-related protein